jgi:1,4-dihydroxy-2-naphthoyl-CoA synthase
MSPMTIALVNVFYEKRESIAYVTLNRPKVLNALDAATWADLRSAFEDAKADSAVRGVILMLQQVTLGAVSLGNIAIHAPGDDRDLEVP